MKEQSSQSLLLTNLQTLQNNLERNEYETKSRLGSQIEILEKEAGLLKERLHNEEERERGLKTHTRLRWVWLIGKWVWLNIKLFLILNVYCDSTCTCIGSGFISEIIDGSI